MKLLCVFSTLPNANRYIDWVKPTEPGAPLIEGESVTIKGGYGVANENFVTADGAAVTMVSEAQAELLKRNSVFKLHEKNGFVKLAQVDKPPGERDAEGAAADMERRDGSSPLVPEDFSANGLKPPKAAKSAK